MFAASSLREAVTELASEYERQTGADLVLVFAATSAVSRQLSQGAPADVVLLADETWADWLVSEGVVENVQPFAGNTLALVGQALENYPEVSSLSGVLQSKIVAMAEVSAVPAGRYARAALDSLGLWDPQNSTYVQASNVRAALRFVERGEADFGIGYASDVVALPSLRTVFRFPADSHPPIVYSAAPVTDQGQDFTDFLISDPGQDILESWGFSPVEQP